MDSIHDKFQIEKEGDSYINQMNAFILEVTNYDEEYNIYVESTASKRVYPDSFIRYDIAGYETEEKAWIKQWARPHKSRVFSRDTLKPAAKMEYWFQDDFSMNCDTFVFFFTFFPEKDFGFRIRWTKAYTLEDQKLVGLAH